LPEEIGERGGADGRPKSEAEAAVDAENLAGDEVRAGSEEKNRRGHVGGSTIALHRGAAGEVLVFFGHLAVDDHAGSDAVDTDFRGKGFGHGLGEHVQSGFGGAVVGVGGPGMETAERADVDDAAACGFEIGIGGLGGEEGAAGVGFEHGVPLFDGDVLEGGGFVAAGVVDEDIEAGEAVGGGFDGGAHLSGVAEVGVEGGCPDAASLKVGDGFAGSGFRFAEGDGDMSSGIGESEGEGASDAFGGSSDQGDLILERTLGRGHGLILNSGQATFRAGGATGEGRANIQGGKRRNPTMKSFGCWGVAASLMLAVCAGCAGNGAAGKAQVGPAAIAPDDAAMHPNPNAPYILAGGTPRLVPRATALDAQNAGPCDPEVLSVEEIAGDANGIFRSVKLAFMNRGAAPCRLGGYPSVALVDPEGEEIGSLKMEKVTAAEVVAELGKEQTAETSGPAPAVVLMPHAVAAFQIVWSSGATCSSVARILVTAPGTQRTFSIPQPLRICAGRIQVTALRLDQGDV
jgi:Protein of unknown function (DUF4232)